MALAAENPELGSLVERNGIPPLWTRDPGFATMVHLILEQQVSLASADAAMRRLEDSIGPTDAEAFLTLSDEQLRSIGFSRQKAGYVRGVARGVLDGSIVFDDIGRMDDGNAIARLLEIRGVGPWTAACYLLFCLLRPDVWPSGDRALQVAVGRLDGLPDVPDVAATNRRATDWIPYRSVAARILWHEYLGGGAEERIARSGR